MGWFYFLGGLSLVWLLGIAAITVMNGICDCEFPDDDPFKGLDE